MGFQQSSKLCLSLRKLLLFVKSVRTDPVYRDTVKTFFKVRSTVTIDCFRLVINRCRYYAPFSTFPIYYSINSVSPNGLYKQQQLYHTKNFVEVEITKGTQLVDNQRITP